MRTRQVVAAWMHVVTSSFVLVLVSGLWLAAAMLAPHFEGTFVPGLVAMFGRPIAIALLAFAALELAAAVALLRRRAWSRLVLMGISVVQLAVFPIGTAVSLYTFWALLRPPRMSELPSA